MRYILGLHIPNLQQELSLQCCPKSGNSIFKFQTRKSEMKQVTKTYWKTKDFMNLWIRIEILNQLCCGTCLSLSCFQRDWRTTRNFTERKREREKEREFRDKFHKKSQCGRFWANWVWIEVAFCVAQWIICWLVVRRSWEVLLVFDWSSLTEFMRCLFLKCFTECVRACVCLYACRECSIAVVSTTTLSNKGMYRRCVFIDICFDFPFHYNKRTTINSID